MPGSAFDIKVSTHRKTRISNRLLAHAKPCWSQYPQAGVGLPINCWSISTSLMCGLRRQAVRKTGGILSVTAFIRRSQGGGEMEFGNSKQAQASAVSHSETKLW